MSMKTTFSCGTWILALALLAGCTAARAPVRNLGAAYNLIIVTIDTLRADHVGTNGYERRTTPHIDELAGRSAVFTQAIAQSSWTRSSMASLMTGLYPTTVGVTCHNFRVPKAGCDVLPQSATTLAEVLHARGFRTASIVANINVDAVFGFDQGFDEMHSVSSELSARDPDWRVHNDWFNKTTTALTEMALEWLREHGGDERPFLLNLHYLDPHDPYDPPEPHRGAFRAASYDVDPRSREAIALYDGEILHVDHEFGRVLEQLETSGLAARTAIVIVSDHGEEFHEHGGVRHGFTMYDEQIRVPLIVHVPGLTDAGGRFDGQVRLIDVMPTVLELLGAGAPADLQGVSLLPALNGERHDALPALSEWGYSFDVSWRVPPWKLIFDIQTETPRLFHLDSDPGEHLDLAQQERRRTAQMVAELTDTLSRAIEAGRRLSSEEGEIALSPEQIDQLRTLGYVDGSR
ncbi:MAG: sulfatase [Acidobacteriota bacterium]|nr:sulfatase [Acidobacteriota bacterium]